MASARCNRHHVFLLQVGNEVKQHSVCGGLHAQLPLRVAAAAENGAGLRHGQRVFVAGTRCEFARECIARAREMHGGVHEMQGQHPHATRAILTLSDLKCSNETYLRDGHR